MYVPTDYLMLIQCKVSNNLLLLFVFYCCTKKSDNREPIVDVCMMQNLLRVAWSPDGGQVSAGSGDRFVYIWDTTSRRILYKLPGHSGSVNEVDFHPFEPIGKWLITSLHSLSSDSLFDCYGFLYSLYCIVCFIACFFIARKVLSLVAFFMVLQCLSPSPVHVTRKQLQQVSETFRIYLQSLCSGAWCDVCCASHQLLYIVHI